MLSFTVALIPIELIYHVVVTYSKRNKVIPYAYTCTQFRIRKRFAFCLSDYACMLPNTMSATETALNLHGRIRADYEAPKHMR